jgi:hypothetical protein
MLVFFPVTTKVINIYLVESRNIVRWVSFPPQKKYRTCKLILTKKKNIKVVW